LFLHHGGGDQLLRCGDIEANPGPNPGDSSASSSSGNARQTRLSASYTSRSAKEPSLTEVMTKLNDMSQKIDSVQEDTRQIRQDHNALREVVTSIKEEIKELYHRNKTLEQQNSDLRDRVSDLELKYDDLENRSRRNNLIFHGVGKRDGETTEECENTLRDIITDKLELADTIEFDRVHRLGSKSDSPIIARCCSYRLKVKILKARQKFRRRFLGESS